MHQGRELILNDGYGSYRTSPMLCVMGGRSLLMTGGVVVVVVVGGRTGPGHELWEGTQCCTCNDRKFTLGCIYFLVFLYPD